MKHSSQGRIHGNACRIRNVMLTCPLQQRKTRHDTYSAIHSVRLCQRSARRGIARRSVHLLLYALPHSGTASGPGVPTRVEKTEDIAPRVPDDMLRATYRSERYSPGRGESSECGRVGSTSRFRENRTQTTRYLVCSQGSYRILTTLTTISRQKCQLGLITGTVAYATLGQCANISLDLKVLSILAASRGETSAALA